MLCGRVARQTFLKYSFWCCRLEFFIRNGKLWKWSELLGWSGTRQWSKPGLSFWGTRSVWTRIVSFINSSFGNWDIYSEQYLNRNFQNFENVAASPQVPFSNVSQFGGSFLDPSQTSGNIYGQADFGQQKSYTGNEFDDEPPLLEGLSIDETQKLISWNSNDFRLSELGINPQHIMQKVSTKRRCVLNRWRESTSFRRLTRTQCFKFDTEQLK